MSTYKIIRFFAASPGHREEIREGLTLEEAQEHCRNPEAASDTCSPEGDERTAKHGAWFDGYEEE